MQKDWDPLSALTYYLLSPICPQSSKISMVNFGHLVASHTLWLKASFIFRMKSEYRMTAILAGKLTVGTCLCFPFPRLQMCNATLDFFTWVLGIQVTHTLVAFHLISLAPSSGTFKTSPPVSNHRKTRGPSTTQSVCAQPCIKIYPWCSNEMILLMC